jgi:hypothetical protein
VHGLGDPRSPSPRSSGRCCNPQDQIWDLQSFLSPSLLGSPAAITGVAVDVLLLARSVGQQRCRFHAIQTSLPHREPSRTPFSYHRCAYLQALPNWPFARRSFSRRGGPRRCTRVRQQRRFGRGVRQSDNGGTGGMCRVCVRGITARFFSWLVGVECFFSVQRGEAKKKSVRCGTELRTYQPTNLPTNHHL